MKCEKCKNDHDGSYGSGRFCSVVCSRSFATFINRKEISEKVSKSLGGRGRGNETKKCEFCSIEFETPKRRPLRYCSKRCSAKHRVTFPENIEKMKNVMLKKVINGTHIGWKSRKGKLPSYPEQFFIGVLNNNHILFERDYNVSKWFIDFAIRDKMIALEVDGKQHEWRREKDAEKDAYLKSQGWKVHRIKWKSINNDAGKEYIKSEIDKFLELYRSVA